MLLEAGSDTDRLLVAEEVLELLSALLDPNEAELERRRSVADHVVGGVVRELHLERVRALAQLVALARAGTRPAQQRCPSTSTVTTSVRPVKVESCPTG